MTETGGRTAATALFGRTAEACLSAVAAYEAEHAPDVRFQRHVLLALAALDACSRRAELEPADLRFLGDAAAAAAGVCRTELPNDTLVAVAGCLDEVADVCARLLGDEPRPSEWRSFLFDDIDLRVRRTRSEWRLRRSDEETAARVFDEALEALEPSLSNYRIAEITVQVLAWHTHLDEQIS